MESAPAYPVQTTTALELEHLSKAYLVGNEPQVVLNDASFSIAEGEFVALVGPSGCGKTTVLRIIASLTRPSAGQVQLFGKQASKNTGQFGFVFQSPNLLPWLTALDNVKIGLEMFGMAKGSEARQRAMLALEEVGLGSAAMKRPGELSGGMQQRVGIARALAHDPDVLLMDEPFGALDAITRETLDFQLLDYWEASRRTVLFVTHSIEEAVLLSDRVICMKPDPGEIIADYKVPFARPRTAEQLTDPQFLEEVRAVRKELKKYYS